MSHVEDVLEDHPVALPGGTMLNDYRIDAVLGQGGFGITYLAHDTLLDEQVAIKEYFPVDNAVRTRELSARARTARGRDVFRAGLTAFLDEARIIARFRHPNIMQVRRFFETRGTGYIVLNYELGRSLEEVMADAPLPEDGLLSIMNGILCGLEVIHERAVLHRDLKPRNVIVRDDGTPVLLDFGAARDFSLRNSFTVTQIASSGYSPPEQYGVGDQHGPWSDLYALGSIMYRGVTGRMPVDSLSRLRNDPLVPASKAAAGRYSDALLRTIDRMMQIDETRRPLAVAVVRKILPALAQVRTIPLAAFPGLPMKEPVSHDWSRRTRRTRRIFAWSSLAASVRRGLTRTALPVRNALPVCKLLPALKAAVARARHILARVATSAWGILEAGRLRVAARPAPLVAASIAVLLAVGVGAFLIRHGGERIATAPSGAASDVIARGEVPAAPSGTDRPAPAARSPSATPPDVAAGSQPSAPASPQVSGRPAPVPPPAARPAPEATGQSAGVVTPTPSGPAPVGVASPSPSAPNPPVGEVQPSSGNPSADGSRTIAASSDRAGETRAAGDQRAAGAPGVNAAPDAARPSPQGGPPAIADGRSPNDAEGAPVPAAGRHDASAALTGGTPSIAGGTSPQLADQGGFTSDEGDIQGVDAAFTAGAIPFLTPADRLNVAIALARGGETALALSTDGKHGISAGQDSSVIARDHAMKDCVKAGGLDCQLYAADGQLLWPDFDPSVTTSFITGLPGGTASALPKRAHPDMPGFVHAQRRWPRSRPAKPPSCGSRCGVSASRVLRKLHHPRRPVMVQQRQPTLFDYLFGVQPGPAAARPDRGKSRGR